MIGNYSGRLNVINAPELEVVDDEASDQGEEERYEVEDILDMRTKADGTGSLECLVKWKGYEHFADTWEPASMLEEDVPDMIAAYLERSTCEAINLQQRPKKRQRLGEASTSDQATINAPFRFPSPPTTATIEPVPRLSRSLSPSLPTNLTLLKPAGQAIIVDEEKRHNKVMPTSHRLDVPSTSRAPSPQAPAVTSSTCTGKKLRILFANQWALDMQVVDSTALGTVYSFISSALDAEHTNCDFKLIDTVLRKPLDQSQNRIKTLKDLGLRPPSKLKLEFLDSSVNELPIPPMTAELVNAAQTLPAVQTVAMANSAEREAAEKQEVASLANKPKRRLQHATGVRSNVKSLPKAAPPPKKRKAKGTAYDSEADGDFEPDG